MGKVLQERGSGSLPSSTEINPRDHVKSISTTVETKTSSIRRLIDDCYEEKEALKSLLMNKPRMGYQIEASMNVHDSTILEDSLPPKEKDPGSLSELAPTKLIVKLADRTIKHPKGIAENVLVGEALILNRSLDSAYGDYIKLNDLNEPFELRRYQVEDLGLTIEDGKVIDEPMIEEDLNRRVSQMMES
ncbi:hypothetical protein Tco_0793070 [Tanacetum coccineum]